MSQRSAKMGRRLDKIERRVNSLEEYRSLLRPVSVGAKKAKTLDAVLAGALAGLTAATIMVACAKAEEPQATREPAPPEVEVIEEAVQIPEMEENRLIEAALLARAERLDNVRITHYCLCRRCCGKDPGHPAYGITASGRRATPGVTAAVDPDLIPLGSTIMIRQADGSWAYYKADDTGSGVKGRHIDLCMGSHQEALEAGVKTATIYVVWE